MGPGPAETAAGRRKKLIQLIHIGKANLGLTEDAYRALLRGATDKQSCAEMTAGELAAVLRVMRRNGFGAFPRRVVPAERGGATLAQLEYIKGMWALAARVKTGAALAAFIRRIAHVDDIRFLDVPSAQKVILALRDIAVKAGCDPEGIPGGVP
jgi:hypothetical protein